MARINEYLTVGDAADFLGVSKDTLRRWDRSGQLPARRHPVSRYRLYATRELEEILLRLQSEAGSSKGTKPKPIRRSR